MEALRCLLDGADALPPLPAGENKPKSKLCTLLSRVGRLMKSNFIDTTNKKTKLSPISVPAPPAKRQRMHQVVSPTSASPTPSRSYNRTASSSLSSESTIGTPNSTNNAISEVMYQGLGVSPPSLHPPPPISLPSSTLQHQSTFNIKSWSPSTINICSYQIGCGCYDRCDVLRVKS
jgi:hypothetical protein